MGDEELFNEIMWVMQHYGSDAGERAEPGSKLRAQAARIVAFVVQRDEAQALLRQSGYDMVKVVSSKA